VVAITRAGTRDTYESTGVAPSRTASDGHTALELQHDAGDVLIAQHEFRLGEVGHVVGFPGAILGGAAHQRVVARRQRREDEPAIRPG
jgi:hypothetical protein